MEYATKRYRSNLINWGILPLTWEGEFTWEEGAVLRLPGVRKAIAEGKEEITGFIGDREIKMSVGQLSDKEREIILAGCLMNWYRENGK